MIVNLFNEQTTTNLKPIIDESETLSLTLFVDSSFSLPMSILETITFESYELLQGERNYFTWRKSIEYKIEILGLESFMGPDARPSMHGFPLPPEVESYSIAKFGHVVQNLVHKSIGNPEIVKLLKQQHHLGTALLDFIEQKFGTFSQDTLIRAHSEISDLSTMGIYDMLRDLENLPSWFFRDWIPEEKTVIFTTFMKVPAITDLYNRSKLLYEELSWPLFLEILRKNYHPPISTSPPDTLADDIDVFEKQRVRRCFKCWGWAHTKAKCTAPYFCNRDGTFLSYNDPYPGRPLGSRNVSRPRKNLKRAYADF